MYEQKYHHKNMVQMMTKSMIEIIIKIKSAQIDKKNAMENRRQPEQSVYFRFFLALTGCGSSSLCELRV